ncbi:MAG TPA: response regulator [Thermoplasmatales archaeon]|nr:response regulator [Thermoplasmatales archaeon]HEX17376.1 response regulator [Thermoplasmatales archaeon]
MLKRRERLKYSRRGDGTMVRVMVVDDEEDLRNLVKMVMEKEGFEVESAENGKDFLEKVDDFRPDIVILDVMMPGLTTKEILEKLREKSLDPKIFLLTVVRFSEDEIKRLSEIGNIVEYITKPFDIPDLVARISKHAEA